MKKDFDYVHVVATQIYTDFTADLYIKQSCTALSVLDSDSLNAYLLKTKMLPV